MNRRFRVVASSVGLAFAATLAIQACSGDDASSGGAPGSGGDAGTPDASSGGSGGATGSGGAGTGGTTGTGGASADGGDGGPSGPVCGNGKLESGETCDTAIAAGQPGACPTTASCDDQNPCTTDPVDADGTCGAECGAHVVASANASTKDQCCPSGATAATDADCDPNCGDGVLDSGETCDPGIATGTGACPTSCPDDGDPCTVEALVTANPCAPTCGKTTITTATAGDSCCPGGANANVDSDCQAECGNGVVEPGEQCEGATATCVSCKYVPTAFRMTKLELRDPHPFLDTGSACPDVLAVINNLIADNFSGDTAVGDSGVGDGILDLSFVFVARPLDQQGTAMADFYQAACNAPAPTDGCTPDPAFPAQSFTYSNQATGTCLAPVTSRISSYDPPIDPATAGTGGCMLSSRRTLTLTLGDIVLTFDQARVGAEWVADPATGLIHGVFEGFLTEARVQAITLPPSLASQPLSAVFPKGTGMCTSVNDIDTLDDTPTGTPGWWWYLNFEAERVTWSE